MKGKLVKYLLGVLVLIISFIAYQVIRTNAIYDNSQVINIEASESIYLRVLNEFGFTNSLLIEMQKLTKYDSIFTFKTREDAGLLWILAEQNEIDIRDISFRSADLSEDIDGTYANYVADTPSLGISYRIKRNISLGSHPILYLSNDATPNLKRNQTHEYWEIINQPSVELRNEKEQLVYRSDFTDPTKILLFKRQSSLNILFLQKLKSPEGNLEAQD